MQCVGILLVLASWCATGITGEILTVAVRYPPTSRISFLALRGNALGLNWSKGKKLQPTQRPHTYAIDLHYTKADIGKTVEMKVLADDQVWQIGANELVVLPSVQSGVELYPFFFTHAGHYEYPIYNLYSPQLNNTRTMVVYLPPSYNENTLKNYKNVIIMHDGQNLFNASTSFGGVAWKCDKTVDLLVNEGEMDEVVIVGLYNTGQNRINEYTYSYDKKYKAGGEGDLYLDFIRDTAIPFAQKKYSRLTLSQPTLGIVGSSLGGLISCYAGWTRPAEYGITGCMSSSFWWNNFDFISYVMKKWPTIPPNNQPIYEDVGSEEPQSMQEGLKRVSKAMLERGMVRNKTLWTYVQPGGHHNEYWWGKRFWRPMDILYPPRPRATTPTS